jgi:hypothetical protein
VNDRDAGLAYVCPTDPINDYYDIRSMIPEGCDQDFSGHDMMQPLRDPRSRRRGRRRAAPRGRLWADISAWSAERVSSGDPFKAVDSVEVLDSADAPYIEDVLPDAEIPGFGALATGNMG